MKNVINKVRFYYHSMQYNKNRVLLEDCLCQQMKKDIELKMHYHEREAVQRMIKL
ncbi:hypothetical protein [Fredinandcohnia sp. 179-A 10B2 NHS]|uniref:hypothetical protein n=1 Tax=Fredinandcohnia sp. 179-A 10B2 NHS TaxID=3235176 RepID=UPI0039A06E37